MSQKDNAKKENTKDAPVLVKMIHIETQIKADVHPLEQLNYFRAGYRKVEK